MSVLKAFLNPEPINQTKEIFISERFKGEDGKPIPFVIKTISQDVNESLSRKSTVTKVVRGQSVSQYNASAYTNALIVACTVQPDFNDAELCKAYGTVDPQDVPGRMLLAGEYAKLTEAIMNLNGFDINPVIKAEEEAKN